MSSPVISMTLLQVEATSDPVLGREIDLFANDITTIADILPGTMIALQEATRQANKHLREFETAKCEVVEESKKRTVSIPLTDLRRWKILWQRFEHFNLAQSLLARSLLVSLVSQYDAYLGRLLRAVMIKRPEILNGSSKVLSFADLNDFASIEAAREYILQKEVETFLRSSHSDQFDWMEKTFKLPLRRELAAWPVFVELTERRNLMVHADGVVSSQYISVCKAHKCDLGGTQEGTRLGVSQKYFDSAFSCIYEIGTKLGQVLWRKVFPSEAPAADSQLLRQTYDLIDMGKYALAIPLLDCAAEYFDFASEATELMVTVNRAQAHKWNGNDERCSSIMKGVDWSAKGDQFRLANAVLAEDWSQASSLVKRIGKDGPVTQTDYRDWPLFKAFRKQELFLQAYEAVFGEAFPQRSQVSNVEPPVAKDATPQGVLAGTTASA